MLLLVALALVQLPLAAHASAYDGDTERCGTPYPFWWRYDGPRTDVVVTDWEISSAGESFKVSLTLVNQGETTFEGGMNFALTQAVVDARGYADPTALAPPSSARSLLGAESLAAGTLPTLRPGEKAVVSVEAKALVKDANHILTLTFNDGDQVAIEAEPIPVPWYWLRILSPKATPGALVIQESLVEPVDSRLEGYKASHVVISIKNVGRIAVEAGTPIRVIHGHSGSAGGYWGPDDVIDPHNPGNPYASFFREEVYSGRLDRTLNPGERLELDTNVNVADGLTGLQQITIAVGK